MRRMSKKAVIIVPFLNEEDNLPELYRRLCAVFENLEETGQFLFVDDGSTDGSVACLEEFRQTDDRVRILQLSRNFGHQIAITAGLDHADGDAAIIMDADLQDPPEVIPELLAKWRDGFEVVYAVRRRREGETWLKKFLAASFYRLFRNLTKVDVPLNSGDFRLVDRVVVDSLRDIRELHRFMRGLTCWVGFRQCAVHYDRDARYAGTTKYPVWKSACLAFDAITSFSASPLRWTVGFGVLACLIAMIWFLHILVTMFFYPGRMVQGWTSIIAAIILMGGIQLVSIGVLGQYLGRTFEEVKKRPLYIIRAERGRNGGS